MKTRTILAAFLVASLAAPALAGSRSQAQKPFKKPESLSSGQGTMTQIGDRARDGSWQQ